MNQWTRRLGVVPILGLIAVLGFVSLAAAHNHSGSRTSPVYVALATNHVGEEDGLGQSRILRFELERGDLQRHEVAAFSHLVGEAPRGDIARDGGAMYVAVRRNPQHETADLLVWQNGALDVWASDVYPGSRPCSAPDGGVYVTRGMPQAESNNLTISHFSSKGKGRELYSARALLLHLVAATEQTLVIYRVSEEGAALIHLDASSGRLLRQTTIPGYARDFSSDGSRVDYTNLDESDHKSWIVQSWSLATGEVSNLSRDAVAASAFKRAVPGAKPELSSAQDTIDIDPSRQWIVQQSQTAYALHLRRAGENADWLLGDETMELEGMGFVDGSTVR